MNSKAYIFNESICIVNLPQEHVVRTDYNVFISRSVMEHLIRNFSASYFKMKYKRSRSHRFYLYTFLRAAFITSLIYTFHYTNINRIKISPYYFESIYKSKTIANYVESTFHRTTIQIINNHKNDFNPYIKNIRVGRSVRNKEDKNFEKITSLYEMDNVICNFEKNIENDTFYKINLESLVNICTNSTYTSSKNFDKIVMEYEKIYNLDYIHALLKFLQADKSQDYITYDDFDEDYPVENYLFGRTKDDIEKENESCGYTDAVISNTAYILKENVLRCLNYMTNEEHGCNFESIKNTIIITSILEKFKNRDSISINIGYSSSKTGRFIAIKNILQRLPSRYRNILLDNYKEVDLQSACYSLLLSLAKKHGYTGHCPEIESMMKMGSKEYRSVLAKRCGLEVEVIKKMSTAIGFGRTLNTFVHSGETYRKKDLKFFRDPKVIELIDEFRELNTFIINKTLKKYNDEYHVIYNEMHKPRLVENAELEYSKLVAHIYQGCEARVLNTVVHNTMIGKKNLLNYCGLLLHDGIYVEKDKVDINLILDMENTVKNKLGFNVKYSIKD